MDGQLCYNQMKNIVIKDSVWFCDKAKRGFLGGHLSVKGVAAEFS